MHCGFLFYLLFSVGTCANTNYFYELGEIGDNIDEEDVDFGSYQQFHNYGRLNNLIAIADFGNTDVDKISVYNGHQTVTSRSSTGINDIYNSTGRTNNDEQFQSKLSPSGDYVFGMLLISIGFISFIGNSSILVVFYFKQHGPSPVEVFLLNLAIVDLLLTIASYPMTVIASFKHGWSFGEIGCHLYAFVCYFLGLASIFSIMGIAVIRYLKTCISATGNQITCWTSCKMIASGYGFALMCAIFPLLGFGNYAVEPFGLSCTLEWIAKDNVSQIYIVFVAVFCVSVPLLTVLFCYIRIILLIRQSNALVRSNGVKKRNMTGSDVQLTWISGLVTLGFVVGWCPYTVVSLWASFRGEVILPMWATPIPVLMAKSCIAYNPLIYTFFTSRYREDFVNVFRRWLQLHSHTTPAQKNNLLDKTRQIGATRNEKELSPQNSGSSSRQLTKVTSLAPTKSTPTCQRVQHEENVLDGNNCISVEQVNNNNGDGNCSQYDRQQEAATLIVREISDSCRITMIGVSDGYAATTGNWNLRSLLNFRCSNSVEENV